MTNNEATIGGIHTGKTGDADTLVLKKKYVAIGWFLMGNLGNLKVDPEVSKLKVAEVYPVWIYWQDIFSSDLPW